MKNYIGNLYNRKTYLIKILNNLTLAKKIFPKKCRKITFLLNVLKSATIIQYTIKGRFMNR